MPISLPATQVETHSIGGNVVATTDAAAISNASIDFLGNVIVVTFSTGTPASNAFGTAKFAAKQFQITIDTSTGNWSSSAGTSGTLTPTQLTTLATNQRTFKNGLEQLAIVIGLIAGSVTLWT